MFELLELGRLELSLPAATLMFPVFVATRLVPCGLVVCKGRSWGDWSISIPGKANRDQLI